MAKSKATFHLMAVPRKFTPQVLAAGGRFLKMKEKQLQAKTLKLIQLKDPAHPIIHILDPSQHRVFEVWGEQHVEEISICHAVFDKNRGSGYRVFKGKPELTSCKECLKILAQKKAATE